MVRMRKYANAGAKLHCGGEVGVVRGGRRCATAVAEVWLRGRVGVLGWWRKCVGVDTYVC